MNIVYSEDMNKSGTNMRRVAEIDGMFYPFYFSLNTAQVTWGHWFANHSKSGVVYVSDPYKTLEGAKNQFRN